MAVGVCAASKQLQVTLKEESVAFPARDVKESCFFVNHTNLHSLELAVFAGCVAKFARGGVTPRGAHILLLLHLNLNLN